ncbi:MULTISPECIES: LysR family transcriptional regulator [unclassified Francisella]|uniref:LysR family transcriptional regulator n=1 Tax=unclassified Francisella TaxID=2610885 RepID=UPI002E37CA78|nr:MULTISPECIES: LysR family transcriptional regulator [unclassified Francisella]MED7819330.1 LysR family transcriptional regulator [Francisella sp. 19S2-4]MED7830130.1 LysR family transcriptional regulator [Francisella sp. 19S2-10]
MIKKNDLPPLNSLVVFVAVVKCASYSKAAEELCMTHSAVSQSIKKLESFLNKRLFITSKKNVVITELAMSYYNYIDTFINNIYDVSKRFRQTENQTFSLNCMSTLSANWIIPKFDQFIEQFKKFNIQLTSLGRRVNFDYDDIDLSIEYGNESKFIDNYKKKITDGELVLVFNNKDKSLSCKDIIANNRLIYIDEKMRMNDYYEWCQYNNINPDITNKIVLKSSIQAIQACIAGIGYFITEKLLVDEYIKNDVLYKPDQLNCPVSKAYYLISKESDSEIFEEVYKNLLLTYDI